VMKGFGRIAAMAMGLVLLLMLAAPAAVMAQQPEGRPGRKRGEAVKPTSYYPIWAPLTWAATTVECCSSSGSGYQRWAFCSGW